MNRSIASLYIVWLLAGCAESSTGELAQSPPQPAEMDSALEIGQRAYEDICAGFNAMPAKGGESQLDEATVTKAAEYMMSLVYPEAPRG